ncbi:MAG: SUMF1/EgtB/PvdO family nonheme iron enzyme [Planctomycetes bacterium]|nr:SUMF1/EgtB/PvdO family nonheme iron enzyme [Planctomycetota bacterium]
MVPRHDPESVYAQVLAEGGLPARFLSLVERDGEKVVVVRRTDHAVREILAAMDGGASGADLQAGFPGVTSEDVRAILELSRRVDEIAGRRSASRRTVRKRPGLETTEETIVVPPPPPERRRNPGSGSHARSRTGSACATPDKDVRKPVATGAEPEIAPAAGDRYEIREELGRGGMGQVLVAHDRELRRDVALKILREDLSSDPRYAQRFLEEAQASAQLEHPNIVPTYDFGHLPDGRVYFAMKLVRGRTLARAIEELRAQKSRALERMRDSESQAHARPRTGSAGATPDKYFGLELLLQIFLKMCDGVAYAHARGVIHRDLKPANVMLGEFGEVLLMDWGLAKLLPRRRRQTTGSRKRVAPDVHTLREESDLVLTRDGEIAGTALYMSPEQARGDQDHVDQQSDVYALGSILYEMLTLSAPFEGAEGDEIFERIANEDPEPPARRAPARRIPRELSAICLKGLAKEKRDRYRTAAALQEDIQRFLAHQPVRAAPDNPLRLAGKWAVRHPTLSAAVSIALVVSALAGAVLRVQWTEARNQNRLRLDGYRASGRAHQERAAALLDECADGAARGDVPLEELRLVVREYDLARSWYEMLRKEEEGSEAYEAVVRSYLGQARAARLEEIMKKTPGEYPEAVRYLEAARAADTERRFAGEIDAALRDAAAIVTVTLSLAPAGATVEVFRVEGPFCEETSLFEEVAGDSPVVLDLAAGSYVLAARAPGRAPARLPLYLERYFDRNRELSLSLLPAEEVPPGFVHVPAGWFRAGEDASWTRIEKDFLIAEREVAFGEYVEFLSSLPEAKRAEFAPAATTLGDRQQDLLPVVQELADWEKYPAVGISLGQAIPYARWRSEESRGAFRFRLPTDMEWEYAARGADGRPYPWGWTFDRERTNMARTKEHNVSLDALQTCLEHAGGRPAGRSVFGCLEMAGNVSEWTSTAEPDFAVFRVRGGAFNSPETGCLTSHYQAMHQMAQYTQIGMRLAADVAK